MDKDKLNNIALSIAKKPKGILAADESTGTITKRFDQIKLESNFENRRKYRELLFTSKEIENFISGVIMYDETIRQNDINGVPFVNLLKNKNIHPGIKVDCGVKALVGSEAEKITEGLDNLEKRIEEYSKVGATFTKWRAVINIGEKIPTNYCLELNAHALARYSRIVQKYNMVPIVEPEIIMDGSHDIEECFQVTSNTLRIVFEHLKFQGVYLGGILLKPNMVISSTNCKKQADIKEVSMMTIKCLKECVPNEVPGIVFLSGGQSYKVATEHLNQMNLIDSDLCNLSFSYGRALQQPVISAWEGKEENKEKAQNEFFKRCKLNSLATLGQYKTEMENT